MAKPLSRQDFLIKDLAVSIAGGGRASTWMPGPDDPTPPTPISPFASVTMHQGLLEAVRGAMTEAIKANKFDDIARAFNAGETGGHPAIRNAIHEIGTAVVASAAFAALGGSSLGLPNPECGGSSLETIPPTLTPVADVGFAVHRVTELPRLRHQLAQAMAYIDKAAVAQAPRGDEIAAVRSRLEAAIKELPAAHGAGR